MGPTQPNTILTRLSSRAVSYLPLRTGDYTIHLFGGGGGTKPEFGKKHPYKSIQKSHMRRSKVIVKLEILQSLQILKGDNHNFHRVIRG